MMGICSWLNCPDIIIIRRPQVVIDAARAKTSVKMAMGTACGVIKTTKTTSSCVLYEIFFFLISLNKNIIKYNIFNYFIIIFLINTTVLLLLTFEHYYCWDKFITMQHSI